MGVEGERVEDGERVRVENWGRDSKLFFQSPEPHRVFSHNKFLAAGICTRMRQRFPQQLFDKSGWRWLLLKRTTAANFTVPDRPRFKYSSNTITRVGTALEHSDTNIVINLPPPVSLSGSPTHTPQRTLLLTSNTASPSFFSILGIHTKSDPIAYADNCNNHTSIKTPPKLQKPYIRRTDSDKLSRFSGLHSAFSLGLLGFAAGLAKVEDCDTSQKKQHEVYTSPVGCWEWARGSGENTARTGRH